MSGSKIPAVGTAAASLSLTAVGLLATIYYVRNPRREDLLDAIPATPDYLAWYEQLEVLIDHRYIVRVESKDCYRYEITGLGLEALRGWTHPLAVTAGSLS